MGREFIDLFDDWASSYDDTVTGHDIQYRAVFENYDKILAEVVSHTEGNVLEFGVGTGNLSAKLLEANHYVIGVEPSKAMRKVASTKYPELTVKDGDFLNYPSPDVSISTIVSTYAFHHLTDEEKQEAVKGFNNILPKHGKVVFADTVFANEEEKKKIIQQAKDNNHHELVYDLTSEYYPLVATVRSLFENNGFAVTFKKMNDFVYLIVAEKK